MVALVTAVLSVGASLGWSIPPDVQQWILGVTPFIVSGVTWVWARQHTTPIVGRHAACSVPPTPGEAGTPVPPTPVETGTTPPADEGGTGGV